MATHCAVSAGQLTPQTSQIYAVSSLERPSPLLLRAVTSLEFAAFCEHANRHSGDGQQENGQRRNEWNSRRSWQCC